MLKVGCSDVESYAFYKQYIRSKKNNVKFNQLSKEEQEELIKRTQSGDEEYREQLILSNLNLVIYIVELYYSAQDEKTKEDIFQLGMEGLIIGINNIIKYDSKKLSLSTWLSYYIRRTILTKINKLNYDTTICSDTLRRVKAYQKLLETRESNGEEVTDEEAMKCLNISSETLKTIKQFLNRSVIMLGQIIDFNEDKSIILPSENRFEEETINKIINYNLLVFLKSTLSPIDYFVLYYRFLSESTYLHKEIGICFGIGRQRINQIEKRAKEQVKSMINENGQSAMRQNVEERIREREGLDYYNLNVLPLNPNNILLFLYLRDSLTEIEKLVLYENLFGKYIYNRRRLCEKLNISINELIDIENNLKKAIAKIKMTKEYKDFCDQILYEYKTKIYNIDLMHDTFENSYRETSSRLLGAI